MTDAHLTAPRTLLTGEQIRTMSRADMCAYIRREQLRLLHLAELNEADARSWNMLHPDRTPLPEVETEIRAMIRSLNVVGEEPLDV